MHDPFVQVLKGIIIADHRKVISGPLVPQHGSCRYIASSRKRNSHNDASRFDHAVVSHLCSKYQYLHPDKRVIPYTSRAMNLDLMSQGYSLSYVNCVLLPLDHHQVLLNRAAIVLCFKSVNGHEK